MTFVSIVCFMAFIYFLCFTFVLCLLVVTWFPVRNKLQYLIDANLDLAEEAQNRSPEGVRTTIACPGCFFLK